ncbi:hypothetical protein KP509_10G080300 [Ceratopteris richardii]|uniref:Uncharacterized protein n=1 Tax=Ceratopteris richardii TaxID=49495 RepID=A0A8T2U378_CERRI|nr:hypothetical protein KP509_10G080300 [Ceratopteris richardii]
MGGAERFAFNGEAERAAEGDETEEDEIQEVISPGSLAAAAFDAPPVLGAHYAMPYCLRMAVVKKKGASPVYNMGDFCFHDDQQAKLLFIVSARNEHTRSRRVLLDSSGVPIFVAQRKMLSFYNRWDAYRGESAKEEDALFSVQKSAYFQVKMSFNVYLASLRKDSKKPSFKVKGNYHGRDCRVLCGSQVVAEVSILFLISPSSFLPFSCRGS